GVADRTARTWSKSPEVLNQVEAIRREVLDRTVGRLSDNATVAVDEIVRLVKDAASEAVRLQAARAVLAELMAVSNYAALEGRMAEAERRTAQARPKWQGPPPRPGGEGPRADLAGRPSGCPRPLPLGLVRRRLLLRAGRRRMPDTSPRPGRTAASRRRLADV